MRRGIWVIGQNRISLIPSIGLSMICNEHANYPTGNSNGPFDIRVPGGTIATLQGSLTNPAGNIFSLNPPPPLSPLGSDYRVDGFLTSVTYFFKDNITEQEPVNILGISTVPTTEESDCQIEGGINTETDYTTLNNYYLAHIDSFNNSKQSYKQLIDGGDTEALVNTINTASNPFEANAIKNDLLSLSPYVSKEALVALHERSDIFSDQTRYDILSANPDALKTEVVSEVVETSTHQLATTYRTQLVAGNYPLTARTTLESDLAKHKMEANRAVNRALELLAADTLSTLDQQRDWLVKKESFEANLQIANSYFKEGALDSMFNYLAAIPVQMDLTTAQLAVLQDYKVYLLTLKNVLQSNRNFFELDSTELAALDNVALSGEAKPNLAAREFLSIYYNYQFAPLSLTAPDSPLDVAANRAIVLVNDGNDDGFWVAPNPARDQITIRFPEIAEGQTIRLQIRHLTGKVIATIPLQSGQTSFDWNSSQLSEGIYLISFGQEGQIPITKKLFIAN